MNKLAVSEKPIIQDFNGKLIDAIARYILRIGKIYMQNHMVSLKFDTVILKIQFGHVCIWKSLIWNNFKFKVFWVNIDFFLDGNVWLESDDQVSKFIKTGDFKLYIGVIYPKLLYSLRRLLFLTKIHKSVKWLWNFFFLYFDTFFLFLLFGGQFWDFSPRNSRIFVFYCRFDLIFHFFVISSGVFLYFLVNFRHFRLKHWEKFANIDFQIFNKLSAVNTGHFYLDIKTSIFFWSYQNLLFYFIIRQFDIFMIFFKFAVLEVYAVFQGRILDQKDLLRKIDQLLFLRFRRLNKLNTRKLYVLVAIRTF